MANKSEGKIANTKMEANVKGKALDKMKKNPYGGAKTRNNKNFVYTNGDSDEQADVRKYAYPPGDRNK